MKDRIEDLTCDCGASKLKEVNESHSLHLYAHADHWLQCQECGEIITRGVPENHDDGMAFYLPDRREKYDLPECPNHGKMQPTKLWETGTLQCKCRECYRVETAEPEPAPRRDD